MRVSGVDIRIDWSLAVIFWLITLNLGAGLFPRQHPDWAPVASWTVAVVAAILFFASILLHELAHALVGRKQGIAVEGITLFMFGGVAQLRGEPRSAGAELKMAIVGPLASLAIGVASLALAVWLAGLGRADAGNIEATLRRMGPVATILLWLGPVNIGLALFNMLPGFPLDGGRVLRALLWRRTGDLEKATRWASGIGRVVALLFVFAGFLMLFGHRIPLLGRGVTQGLWLLFIGWLLHGAAVQSYRHTMLRHTLRDVRVARLMRREPASVTSRLKVSELAERFLDAPDQSCFPVMNDGTFMGVVCVSDLRKTPRADWPSHTVHEIMTPASALATIGPDEELAEALGKLTAAAVDELPVMEGNRVQGILRLADVIRWVEVRTT